MEFLKKLFKKPPVSEEKEESQAVAETENRVSLIAKIKEDFSPRALVLYVRGNSKLWFDFSKPKKSEKRFPLSAVAAMLVVAVCLSLIVAGTVMRTEAETELYKTQNKIKKLTSEVAQIKTDMEADLDLLTLRDVSVNEYGLVGEEYLNSEYLPTENEEKIVVYR